MSKFKIGEKVRIKSYKECSKYQTIFSSMRVYCQTFGIVKGRTSSGNSYHIAPNGYLWNEECLEKVNGSGVLDNE